MGELNEEKSGVDLLRKCGNQILVWEHEEVSPGNFRHVDAYMFGNMFFILCKLHARPAKSISELGRWMAKFRRVLRDGKAVHYDIHAINMVQLMSTWKGGLVKYEVQESGVLNRADSIKVWVTEAGEEFVKKETPRFEWLRDRDYLRFNPFRKK